MPGRGTASGGTRGRRPRTRLDPEVRRGLIVDAAEQVFSGRDVAAVTLEEIAEAAGVSRALVYSYFGDKGGVVAAVYFRSFERLDAELLATLDRVGSGSERIRAVVDCYLRFASEHAAAWRLVGSAEAMTHREVIDARRARFDRMAAAWGGTPQARLFARAVVSLLEGAALEWIDATDLTLEQATAVVHQMIWSGLVGLEGHDAITFPHEGAGGMVPHLPSAANRV